MILIEKNKEKIEEVSVGYKTPFISHVTVDRFVKEISEFRMCVPLRGDKVCDVLTKY